MNDDFTTTLFHNPSHNNYPVYYKTTLSTGSSSASNSTSWSNQQSSSQSDIEFSSSQPESSSQWLFNQNQPQQLNQLSDDTMMTESSSNSIDSMQPTLPSIKPSSSVFFPNSLTQLPQNQQQLKDVPPVQMWQFLVELLEDKRAHHLIRWGSDLEFHIHNSAEVARRWSMRNTRTNTFINANANDTHHTTHQHQRKFGRMMRYYYAKKKILQKMAGKSGTYRFIINIQPYLSQIRHQHQQQQQLQQLHHQHNQLLAMQQ